MYESTSEPQRPFSCLTQTKKNTKTTKNISTPTEKSTTKMALTSWTEYHESLLKNEPWVEKLKKQSEATLEFVNNPKGLMMTGPRRRRWRKETRTTWNGSSS
jgi:hypothetical protein